VRKSALLALALLAPPAAAEELNLYEWIGVAPAVAIGRHQGIDGRDALFTSSRFLRGAAGAERIGIDLRKANVERNPDADPRPLRLDEGREYVVLLGPSTRARRDGVPVYRLVRGVRGLRPLPDEGREAFLQALTRCIAIQDRADDGQVWLGLRSLLADDNPLLVEIALDQHLKFRRGEPEQLPVLSRLLAHPDSAWRERAARLIGQIAAAYRAELPDPPRLRGELAARARADSAVSVRVAATQALACFADEARATLQEISRDDPDQSVRYAAEKLLLGTRPAAPR